MEHSITVQNLRCGGCANTITRKLSAISGVKDITIDIDASQISFQAENKDIIQQVSAQLSALGYPEFNKDNSLGLKAKSFISCATGKFGS